MKICHVCAAECSDDAELCPICGAELIAEETEATEETTVEIIINRPVLVAAVEDIVTAEIFRDALTENNIPFTCNDPEMKLVFGGGFVAEEIYVDEINLEKAQSLYDEVLNSEPAFDETFDPDFENEDFEAKSDIIDGAK